MLAVRCVGCQHYDLAAVAPRPHVEDDANTRLFAGVNDDQVPRLHTPHGLLVLAQPIDVDQLRGFTTQEIASFKKLVG